MHREDIKAAIRKSGSSLTEIARELGVTTSALSRTLADSRSNRIEQRISQIIGRPVSEIWPNRYGKGKAQK